MNRRTASKQAFVAGRGLAFAAVGSIRYLHAAREAARLPQNKKGRRTAAGAKGKEKLAV
jgi:hypothetical protein